jgi:hypothetical protein
MRARGITAGLLILSLLPGVALGQFLTNPSEVILPDGTRVIPPASAPSAVPTESVMTPVVPGLNVVIGPHVTAGPGVVAPVNPSAGETTGSVTQPPNSAEAPEACSTHNYDVGRTQVRVHRC